jgi:hypothetical protein
MSAALYRGKMDEGYALSWQNKLKVTRTINAKEKRMAKRNFLKAAGILKALVPLAIVAVLALTGCDEAVNTTDEANLIASLATESTVGTGSAEKAEEAVSEKEKPAAKESETAKDSEKPVTEEVKEPEKGVFNLGTAQPQVTYKVSVYDYAAEGQLGYEDFTAVISGVPLAEGEAEAELFSETTLKLKKPDGSDFDIGGSFLVTVFYSTTEGAIGTYYKTAVPFDTNGCARLGIFLSDDEFWIEPNKAIGQDHKPPADTVIEPETEPAALTESAKDAEPVKEQETLAAAVQEDVTQPEAADKPADPVYVIELDTKDYVFPSVVAGYARPAAKVVSVSNTGNVPTGRLSVTLSGANASAFALSAASINNIEAGGTATFAVAPKTALSPATYAAKVTVTGDNGIVESFDVGVTIE